MKAGRAILIAITGVCLACTTPARAERPDGRTNMTLGNAERQAIALKQGMSSEDVERLLGKPKRTSLKQASRGSADASQGSLQWTYTWRDTSERGDTLQVVFTRKAAGDWLVESWEWNPYL